MAKGTVKWFNADKGYGFIQPENGGNDIFVHVTAVNSAGLRSLNEGDVVTYDITSDRGKDCASNLAKAA